MAKLAIKKASTDVTTYVFIQDSSKTTGEGLAGLAYNTGSLVGYYVRPKGGATAITLATQTVTGDHSDGGFVEIDATNMPGVYRLDLPDAVCATGVPSVVVMLKGAANMSPVVLEIQLTDFDLNTAAITAAAVADAVWDEATADHTTATTFGAVKTDTAAILADTGTDGVKIADTQGAITWGQQKIVANVASQGALDIQNSSTSGYGILSKGYTGARLEGNINSTAGTGLLIRGNGGINVYGKNPTYGGVVISNGNNALLELCTKYDSINAKNNVRGFDPEIVNQIQESLTEAVEPLASISDDMTAALEPLAALEPQPKAVQLPPEEGE